MQNGIKANIQGRRRIKFQLEIMHRGLQVIMPDLPTQDECFKAISFSGGFASISFIQTVANKEPISELTAATLRVGEKQFDELARLKKRGLIDKADFFVGSIMREDSKSKKYDYFGRFQNVCKENGWEYHVTNNHAKVVLMRTAKNYYVLETSSNLNENPKIEQFSLENNKQVYDFYYNFFEELRR